MSRATTSANQSAGAACFDALPDKTVIDVENVSIGRIASI
jgi:hypothetical protein